MISSIKEKHKRETFHKYYPEFNLGNQAMTIKSLTNEH